MKPDRLTKLAHKAFPGNGPDDDELLDIVKLLRREQRAQRARFRRIVQQHETRLRIRYALPGGIQYYPGVQACLDILTKLHGRTP